MGDKKNACKIFVETLRIKDTRETYV